MAVIDIERRFINFISSIRSTECLDGFEFEGTKKADFLLQERNIILEIKSLQCDPEYKAHQALAESGPIGASGVDGAVDLDVLLRKVPNSQMLGRKIKNSITKSVQSALEKAHRQIKATKEVLEVRNACGVVCLLNESIGVFSPQLLAQVALYIMEKKKKGQRRYKEIGLVLIISEAHLSYVENQKFYPLVLLEGPQTYKYPEAVLYMKELQNKWALYNGNFIERSESFKASDLKSLDLFERA